ncbi:uridine kinase [candidate division KSB1 bacterium]|nr:uridine kinase [candidate division KSB1 bacterium]
MKSVILIGIAGGSGSGKTMVSQRLYDELGSHKIAIIQQDSYYKDLAHLSLEERSRQNFDHPDALDEELLYDHIKELLKGKYINQPIYDYSLHTRKKDTKRVGNHIIIILEGILILHNPRLRKLMDIKVYVDTDDDIRIIRRLQRDIKERGRSLDSVIQQYEKMVRPMHLQFVEPSKRYADIIIPQGGRNDVAIDILKTKIQAILRERGY